MNKTSNYQLNQWELHDRVMMQDFNADNAKIDAALKAEVDARAAADAAETSARKTTDAAIQAELAKRGNCKIWTTGYTGDGTHGAEHANKITFPGSPIVVWIFDQDSRVMCIGPYKGSCLNYMSGGTCNVDWKGNTVSWYLATGTSYSQMNGPNMAYYVVALLRAD